MSSDFFFQAEDGIRCLTVTGVQTCALPIFTNNTARDFIVRLQANSSGTPTLKTTVVASENTDTASTNDSVSAPLTILDFRSEERRVGKECRSRCLPYQCQ